MKASRERRMIEAGIKVCDSGICEKDKIWSRYSHDKVDIGEELANVIGTFLAPKTDQDPVLSSLLAD